MASTVAKFCCLIALIIMPLRSSSTQPAPASRGVSIIVILMLLRLAAGCMGLRFRYHTGPVCQGQRSH
ncbi:hypothetical protein F5887DRAFT_1283503 [Amanita rubescens]|nr:hypothetical protein F5887DRAFT_1283503 [Amanita rubescens]